MFLPFLLSKYSSASHPQHFPQADEYWEWEGVGRSSISAVLFGFYEAWNSFVSYNLRRKVWAGTCCANSQKGRWSHGPGSPVRKDCGCGCGCGCWCGSSALLRAVAEPAAPHLSSGSPTSSHSHLHPDLGFLPVPPQCVPQFPQDQVGTPRPPPLPWALPDPLGPINTIPCALFAVAGCVYCTHFKVLNKKISTVNFRLLERQSSLYGHITEISFWEVWRKQKQKLPPQQ